MRLCKQVKQSENCFIAQIGGSLGLDDNQEGSDKETTRIRPPTSPVPAAIMIATQESGFWGSQKPVDTDVLMPIV